MHEICLIIIHDPSMRPGLESKLGRPGGPLRPPYSPSLRFPRNPRSQFSGLGNAGTTFFRVLLQCLACIVIRLRSLTVIMAGSDDFI